MARKALSKKVRFEVFKRDSFTCQYCGECAPKVVLHLDHIKPVAKGGTNALTNLITSCFDCNSGKGDRELSDHSVAAKQMRQLKEINERREQIKLIAEWHNEMIGLEDQQLEVVKNRVEEICDYCLSQKAEKEFKSSIKKYGFSSVLSALETSFNQYCHDRSSRDQADKALRYTHRICYWEDQKIKNPEIAEFNKICNMAQKRWYRFNRQALWDAVSNAYYEYGVPTDRLLNAVFQSTGIMKFEEHLEELKGIHHG